MTRSHKLVFMGEPGSGKTTCIAAVSDIPPLNTDVGCTDELAQLKDTTTVAFDYGELTVPDEGRLLLYGLPGQARFRHMFDVVRDGLLGVIILLDASRPQALAGLGETLETYGVELAELPCLAVINKHPNPSMELRWECRELMRRYGVIAPLIAADVRRRADVIRIFELLFLLLEYGPKHGHIGETITWA